MAGRTAIAIDANTTAAEPKRQRVKTELIGLQGLQWQQYSPAAQHSGVCPVLVPILDILDQAG
jgi:hypothetical protein